MKIIYMYNVNTLYFTKKDMEKKYISKILFLSIRNSLIFAVVLYYITFTLIIYRDWIPKLKLVFSLNCNILSLKLIVFSSLIRI